MLLRRLELMGFKSFADKTAVEFGPGISAVVGPNGSGKSNLTDAVRWVLGEGSARTLRGQRMEDVIFGGSPRRRAVPLAEVTLTLDNTDGTLPLPHAEVSVTRRVDRGGSSEYLINRESCRLRDVQDLFAGTGLGRNAYAIIGQGQVDEVLRARAHERRALVEEAAGVTRYRQRLSEGTRRLAAAAAHGDRLADLAAERRRSLEALSRQAERAERHGRLAAELRTLDLRLWAREWGQLLHERDAARAEADAARGGEGECAEGLATIAATQRELAGALAAARSAAEAAGEEAAAAERALERARQAGVLAAGLAEAAAAEAGRASGRRDDLLTRRERQGEEAVAAAGAAEAAAARLQAARAQAESADAALVRAEQERRAAAAGLALAQRELAACRQERAALGGDAAALQAAEVAAEGALERQAALAAAAEEARRRAAAAREEAVGLEQAAEAARRQLQLLRAHRDALAAFAEGLRGRMRALAQVAASGAGYAQGPRTVLAGRARGLPAFAGVIGALGELLEVPPRLAAAISAALGGAVQDIVTESAAAAQAAIEGLKAVQGGRATFLPLGALSVAPLQGDLRALATRPGAVGWAADLVGCAERVRPAALHALGRVLVAEELTAARRLGRESGYRLRIVTLEGDVVHPGGAMSGGSIRGERPGGLLGRDQEQRRLQDRVAMLDADLGRIAAALARLSQAEEAAQRQLTEGRRAAAGFEALAQGTAQQLRQAEAERAAAERRRLELAGRAAAGRAGDPAALARREEGLIAEGAAAAAGLAGAEAGEQRARDAATAARIAAATAAAELGAARAEAGRLERAAAETEGGLAAAQQERARALEALQAQRLAGEEARAAAAAAEVVLAAAAERLRLAREAVAARQAQAAAAAARREQAEAERERLATLARRAEAVLARAEAALAALEARLETAYGLPSAELEGVPPSERPAADREAAAALRRELAELGGVRPEAVQEHRAEAEALAAFSAGLEDLRAASAELGAWGRQLEGTLTDRYEQALGAVRRHFAAIYSRLTGGGSADLVPVALAAEAVSGPGDAPPAALPGLEIVAQPEGKQLAHLGLLSGGERTLVAIALVLAFLQVRPAAFCILDEIEAALDEANVLRCAAYLREVAQGTQFIVVTHQKGTMEAADRLVGVTMGETGVSSLLSVQLAG